MDKKTTRQPIKMVMVRRGSGNILSVPTEKLKTFIRKRALLGTDEISGDGKKLDSDRPSLPVKRIFF
ncbi:MAG: hypothetical protein CM1200mP16_10160 [Nitrospina sp.]|nr:MAG: hypothetical protein CM1200mP16_10160 [Nitrospina sp.]